MFIRFALLGIAAMSICMPEVIADGEVSVFEKRWVLLHPGFPIRSDKHTDEAIKVIRRAAKAGYNGVIVDTHRFTRLQETEPERSYVNVARVVEAARQEGVELIPMVMTINGYSNGILSNDPNLAAGISVRNCLFKVRDGEARVANTHNLIAFGECEEFRNTNRPAGWDWCDEPGKVTFADNTERHSGSSSIRMQDFAAGSTHGNSRLFKRLSVKPWHQYHLRFWLKTDAIGNPDAIRVLVHGDTDQQKRSSLQLRSIEAKATQDWTAHDVVFNTRQNKEVWLYVGAWGARSGMMWLDDFELHEVAGINLLRRAGCPVRVTNEDGSVAYEEGRDFERWQFSDMGRLPYPGYYKVVHPQPSIRLKNDSRIAEGQFLRVSFFHALMHMNNGMSPCLRHNDLFRYLEEHLRVVEKLYSPNSYLLVNDEIRMAGWCELCDRPETTTGTVIAQCTRRCTDIIRRINPKAEMVVWSDMFDPYHNAVDDYWYTRESTKGSWEGLDRDIIVGNWNQGRRAQSLAFFSEQGHRQLIATYYDRGNWQQVTKDWLEAARTYHNIDGIIYATWSNKYDDLEAFMELVQKHASQIPN